MAKYGIVVNRWGGWLVAGWLVAGWLVGCDIINWLGKWTIRVHYGSIGSIGFIRFQ